MLFQLLIEAADALVAFFQLQVAGEDLHTEVVFLVDHDGDGFVGRKGHSARSVPFGVLAGDQVSLDQQLAFERVGLGDIDVKRPFTQSATGQHRAKPFGNLADLPVAAPAQERHPREIPRKANAGRDYDVGELPRGLLPVRQVLR